jgi:DNA-binding transcriptional MerR regulator
VEVRIPQGVPNGSRLRVPGKGNAGAAGGPPGDLYITIRVEEHPFFKRDGDNIRIQVPLTVSEVGLGAKIEVPTIDGRALLKIPQGTQNGQKFRLREKGVFNSRKNTRGDEIVEVVLKAPTVHDERTRELLRDLAQVQTEDVRAEMWQKVYESEDGMARSRARAAYMISAVAEKYEIHPQTLRLYEREGLLAPSRSDGNTRLYTDGDLERLEVILKLTRELGVNLAGVEIILNMREKMEAMQQQIEHFVADLNQEFVQQVTQNRPPEPNSLIPVLRVNSLTATSRVENRRGESRRKQNR